MLRRASLLLLVLAACGKSEKSKTTPPAPTGTAAYFTLGDPASLPTFFDFPWPSDLRLTPRGTPDFNGFLNPARSDMFRGLKAIAGDRPGFPVVPTAYFRFSAALAPRTPDAVIPANKTQPLLLVDVDPTSPEQGKLFPLVASLEPTDAYVPSNLLAVAPRPGIVLRGNTKYAFVVTRELNDATGQKLGVPEALWALAHGESPDAGSASALSSLYAPAWAVLKTLGIAADDVAAMTVFTTGDVVADLNQLSSALVARDAITLGTFGIPTDGGALHDGFCEVDGEVSYPKYQEGEPPFSTGGTFDAGPDGLPTIQGRYDHVPVVLTFPTGPMPAGGYPLVIYFHGSGGVSRAAIDRGTAVQLADGGWENTLGKGPSWVLAPYGFATAAAALPLNPERLPGAAETAYLNISNLAAFRDTFRQGVIEQRMLLHALQSLNVTLSANDLATCQITLPAGESALHYAPDHLFAQGQSMGGMYTNLVSAVEPRIQASVPTGAGGFWSYFVLHTPQVDGQSLLPVLLKTGNQLDFLHPVLSVLETAWEPADPMVFTPRLARRPLPGHPVRPIYEPVGIQDSYFSTQTYDAMALAYGHREAGDVIWPTMQDALALEGLQGLASYPVSNDLTSEDGRAYTGVVAQYRDPTGYDGHALYTQVDAVKHQYACFLSTFLQTGTAVVVAPNDVGTPCQ